MTNPAAGRAARLCGAVSGLLLAAVLASCSGGQGGSGNSAELDQQVRILATQTLGLTGDPATPRGLARVTPDSDPLVKLGQLLFFSQTLAGGYDVSCGTCHHPDFAGSDGLSLGVGVVPKEPSVVGPGRVLDLYRDADPSGDGGPNMHRNSLTTFNSALFDRSLMFDGRVLVLDEQTVPGGHGQRIRTPESGQAGDMNPLNGLMEFTMKGPIVNENEMRGYLYTDLATPTAYRERLMQRLRGTADIRYTPRPNAAGNWLERFRAAFGQPQGTADQLVTMTNVGRALAAYINSQIFVDTPWRRFLEGDAAAISDDAKRGARLFLAAKEEGGLGCNACHQGDRFTDEKFHDVAFPQLGRGFNFSEHYDTGRWIATRVPDDVQAFRTTSLLNVAMTAPYGHTGSFATLADVVAYHADPAKAVDKYDFTLKKLQQFQDGSVSYPEAEARTRQALTRPGFPKAEALLPQRSLKKREIAELVAFLETLTDACVADPACVGQWTPRDGEDPDGHMLVRNRPEKAPQMVDAQRATSYAKSIALEFPAVPARATFADVVNCSNHIGMSSNNGRNMFVERSESGFGLGDRHGYRANTWFGPQQSTLEVALFGGGVTAAYVDDDCWPDLIFTGGNVSGMRIYGNSEGRKFRPLKLLPADTEPEFSGAAVADLNGDYRRELVLGNIKPGSVPVYGLNAKGRYEEIADLPMVRPTFGISFAPLDDSQYLYMYLAHWSGGTGTSGTSPAMWRTDGTNIYPWDAKAHTTSTWVDQKFNFSPKFADFTGDGRMDLVLTSDFTTSNTLRNVPDADGSWHFQNDTDRTSITDENGMGSALLDLDNDGTLEWFVTSIKNDRFSPMANWGISGNRLYRSTSTGQRISFSDITDQAGVRDGFWGWGACAADFNNDGFIDIFHVNGFGRIPDEAVTTPESRETQAFYKQLSAEPYQDKPPRLFINNTDGTFSEEAAAWGIAVPSEGRGVTCFDYDRDGDVDIVVFNHSSKLQFFENRSGSGDGHHFLNIRVVGAPPNTDAVGASVHVTADVGHGHGVQTQLRLAEANSNFNSQNPPDLYFGLGEAPVVKQIRVVWPGGAELTCENVAVNQFVVLDQRAGQGACPPSAVTAASR